MSELKANMNDNEWIAFVEEQWKKGQSYYDSSDTVSPMRQWRIATAILRGETFYEIDPDTGRIRRMPEQYDRFTPKFEILTRYYVNELGQLATVPLAPLVEALDYTPSVLRRRRAQQAVLEYNVAKLRLSSVWLDMASIMLMCGTVFLNPWWDKYADNGRGLANLSAVPGAEIIPIPIGARTDQHVLGYIRTRVVNKHWLSRMVRDVSNIRGAPDSSSVTDSKLASDKDSIVIRELWLRPCEVEPQGRYMLIVYGDKKQILLEDILYEGRLPFFRATYIPSAFSIFGRSFIDMLAPVAQHFAYGMVHLLHMSERIEKTSGVLLRSDIGVDLEALAEQGIGYYHKPATINPEDASWPPMLNMQQGYIPPESYNFVRDLGGYMNFISGQSPVRQGEAPGRVDTATGLAQLSQASLIGLTPAYTTITKAVGEAYEYMLLLNHDRWPYQRKVRVMGVGNLPLSITVSREDIEPDEALHIDVSSSSPYAREMRLQMLQMMAQYRIITPDQLHAGLEELGLSPFRHSTDGATDEQKAHWENQVIFGDGITPGEIPEPLWEAENSAVHLRVHREWLASTEFALLASDAVKAAMLEHYQTTMMYVKGDWIQFTKSDAYLEDAQRLEDAIDNQELAAYEEPEEVRGVEPESK